MKNKSKHSFPSKAEAEVFGREVLAQAAQMVAQGKRISLKSDVPFKLFLTNNTKESRACLRFFLSAVTGRCVRHVRVKNPDLLPDIVGKKQVRLDVNCEFDGSQMADIELQLTRAGDDQKLRAMFYGCKLFVGTLKEGELYKAAPSVYQIFLTDYDPFGDGHFFHRALMRTDDGKLFSDRLQLLFLNLKVPGRIRKDLKKAANWCKFIAGSTRDNVLSELGRDTDWKEELAMATKAYSVITDEERAWAYHLSMDRAETDYKNEMMIARQKAERSGKRKGLREGQKEGLQQGLQQGRKKGLQEGIKQSKQETALRMLKLGKYSMEEIVEISGLSLKELQALQGTA